MHEQYAKLLSLVAHTSANIAEQTMDKNKEEGKLQEYGNAKKMRDNFLDIKQKLDEKQTLENGDFANLYIATGLVAQQIEARARRDEMVVKSYREDIMPKLLKCSQGENSEEIFSVNI